MTTLADEELVARAVGGDARAWDELVGRYDRRLRWIARGFRLSREQADDAAQSTWLLLVQHIGRLREPEHVAGWLSVTMRRQCLRAANQHRREQLRGDWDAIEPTTGEGVEARLLLAERDAALWDAVDRLPERQRRLVLTLFAAQRPSYVEVAQQLSMPVGSIGPVRERALRTLARLLDEPEDLAARRASAASARAEAAAWGGTSA